MSPPPLVSVVMAVYDAERYLDEAVESILTQGSCEFEFIIINDGSTDGSTSILRRHERIDGRIRIHHQENRGLTAALNRGCRLAQGKYIARMDGDDIAAPDRLAKQVDFLERHPAVAVLGGAFEFIDGGGLATRTVCVPLEDRQIKDALSRYNCLAHPTIMMRKQAFDETGGYRIAFLHAEDYDLWLRMAERHEFASLADVVLRYRVHPGQVSARNIRQQAVSVLGAQLAARVRRDTGRDPFANARQVNSAMLTNHGLNGEVISAALVDAYLRWADTMLRAGYHRNVEAILREAAAISCPRGTLPRIADAYVDCASAQYRAGDALGALAPLCKAATLRPTLVPRIFRQAWRTLRKSKRESPNARS